MQLVEAYNKQYNLGMQLKAQKTTGALLTKMTKVFILIMCFWNRPYRKSFSRIISSRLIIINLELDSVDNL